MLSMYNTQVRHITEPNVVVGMAIFCGGLAQLLAGMWEFPRGNMFGATGQYFLLLSEHCYWSSRWPDVFDNPFAHASDILTRPH